MSQSSEDLKKVIAVVFSCENCYHLDTAENMYYNWQKMYKDDNSYVICLINLKRKWFTKVERNAYVK